MYIIKYQRGKRRESGAIDCASNMSAGDYIKDIPITIHTRISDKLRISSAYRKYSNEHFEHWYWETLLWEEDRVKEECNLCHDVNGVVKLHAMIFMQYKL